METLDNLKQAVKEARQLSVREIKNELRTQKKVATGSIRKSISGNVYFRRIKSNVPILGWTVKADPAFNFIQNDTRKNSPRRVLKNGQVVFGKLPVKKSGDEWVLLGNIPLWKQKVKFGGSDFALAVAIAQPRKGIPIVDLARKRFEPQVESLFKSAMKKDFEEEILKDTKAIFNNV